MTTGNEQELRPGEEDALRLLLREMEPGAVAPTEVEQRIRRAVAAEWRSAVTEHAAGNASRRPPVWRRPAFALAASLAAVMITTWVVTTRTPVPAPVVATLSRISGAVESGAGTDWLPVSAGQTLIAGRELVTGPQGRAALNLQHGVTLRLDTDTRIALAGMDRILVKRGAVYLDAGASPSLADPVRIDTVFGTTRHLGTQYEVRVTPPEMLVSVREGRVELTGAASASQSTLARPIVAEAGEQLVVQSTGAVTRGVISGQDAHWNWISDVTPPFAIEQRRLTEFLVWVCRETGRELRFASPQVEQAAGQVILRGSITGLTPDAALTAVMATTSFDYSDENGRLTIRPLTRKAVMR